MALRIEEMTREDVGRRCGLTLRRVDTALRQALDYCAQYTGRPVHGGVSASRRVLRQPQSPTGAKA